MPGVALGYSTSTGLLPYLGEDPPSDERQRNRPVVPRVCRIADVVPLEPDLARRNDDVRLGRAEERIPWVTRHLYAASMRGPGRVSRTDAAK
jgi:hypothetical protein|eukprot:COSAG03_NODE_47_length_16579_cov_37.123665_12_plen_92_part_00